MLSRLQDRTVLVGRILLSLIFVVSSFGKIFGFESAVAAIDARHLPMPSVVALLAILVEAGGGLALLTGCYTRQAALLLAAFTLLAGILFHDFWAAADAQKLMQQIHLMKNLAISGGLLFAAVFGPGSISVDARRRAA